MAVRAADRLTLAVLPSPSYVRLYYLLQSSSLGAPAKPTTNPPVAPWTVTEPTYTAGSTQTLYTVMVTAYGSVSFEYGNVQKSSAYEAAKQAHNLATASKLLAEGLYQVITSTTAPTTSPTGALKAGDQWWVLGTGDQADQLIGIQIWDGAQWRVRQMVADSLVALNSVSTKLLNSTEIWSNEAWLDVINTSVIQANKLNIFATEEFTVMVGNHNTVTGDLNTLETAIAGVNTTATTASTTANTASGVASTALGNAATAQNAAMTASSALATHQIYFQVLTDRVVVGMKNSTNKMEMTGLGIEMKNGTEVVSSWLEGRFYAPTARFTTAKLGNHLVESVTNGTIFRVG